MFLPEGIALMALCVLQITNQYALRGVLVYFIAIYERTRPSTTSYSRHAPFAATSRLFISLKRIFSLLIKSGAISAVTTSDTSTPAATHCWTWSVF